MRYCCSCHKFTAGKPQYCQFCGRSYGVKLCPRGHKNPRAANVCSECGSEELSTPHSSQTGMSLIGTVIGYVILSALVLFALYFAYHLFTDPDSLLWLMKLGLGLALVLLVWMNAFGASGRK
jgi:RNA polymerase subunit RPABC4/transcription elongation factor Spt4